MNWLLLFAACLIFGQGWGFSPSHIESDFPYRAEWVVDVPDNLEEVFSQPFSYLAAGSQSYAFVSEDGKYVVKFFRMKHFALCFKDLFRPARAAKKRKNVSEVFGAYKLAYEEMREGAGLIYLHLNRTDFLNRTLQIVDKAGTIFLIDLDTTLFIVQHKAEPLSAYLERLSPEEREQAIASLMRLIERRSRLRIGDNDLGVSQNFGFVEGIPIQIDVGRLYKADVVSAEAEKTRILERIGNKNLTP